MYKLNNNNAIQQHLLKYVKITRISCILRPATFLKEKKMYSRRRVTIFNKLINVQETYLLTDSIVLYNTAHENQRV